MLIYRFFSTLIFFAILPVYAVIRFCKGKALSVEKLGKFDVPDLGDKVIMYHGVSVGEVIALENLIRKTKETFPDYKLVVTTGTKTGQDIAKKKFENVADFITYFPFDVVPCVKEFLNRINPSIVLMAETELWPTFAFYCKKRNIPLVVINGRISDSTFKSYKLLTPFFKRLFENYHGVFTQSNEDNEKFIAIGSSPDKTKVMRNLKFDVKKVDAQFNFGEGRIIVAGSTHKGEDEVVLNAFAKLKQEFSDIKLLLAPRHLTRENEVKALVEKNGLTYGLRSNNDRFDNNDVIILNTLGELSKVYQICDFAFIGGSFNKTGGHNPLEATVYGKPVISGPSIHNFKDIYWILTRSNAGKVVASPDELYAHMYKMLSNEEFYMQSCNDCKNVFEEQQGALQFVINYLKLTLS